MTPVAIHRTGQGSPAVLVHGSLVGGPLQWSEQAPLGDTGFELLVVDRRGYGQSPPTDGEDFLEDARDIADVLAQETPDGAHLVGDSYGAIASLYAAALRPDLVRSLTVMEPPAFGIVDDPGCRTMVDGARALWGRQDLDDRAFLGEFLRLLGEDPARIPEPIVDVLVGHVPLFRRQRPFWEADPPLADLATHPRPTLVVSGGHLDVFERVCDRIADRLDAERVVVPGAGHEISSLGAPFNEVLLAFWRRVDGVPQGDGPPAPHDVTRGG